MPPVYYAPAAGCQSVDSDGRSADHPAPVMRAVAAIWLLLLVGALAFVGRYGSRTPYMDQWGEIVPLFTGERTVTLEWLWAQHNEHRLPLAKLVEATLVR